MVDLPRPALAEVLAAITDRPVGHWRAEIASPAFVRIERVSSSDVQWTVRLDPYRATTQTRRAPLRSTEPAYEARRVGNTLTRVEVAPAHTITPAEAVEALATARLWPWEPGDDPTRWWCPGCAGNGWLIPTPGFGGAPCPQCHGDDTRPPSLAALVAVASLGAGQLARYVHLAGEIARAAGCAGSRVVWRPMTREAIDAWARCGDYRVSGEGPVTVTQAACLASVDWGSADRVWGRDYWSGAAPWWLPGAGEVIAYAWPVLRDLAARGVHLVALDASRIVLTVEAIGGDRGITTRGQT